MLTKLNGYKTYVAAVSGVVVALLGYFGVKIDPELQQTAIIIIACVLAMTIRHGMKAPK